MPKALNWKNRRPKTAPTKVKGLLEKGKTKEIMPISKLESLPLREVPKKHSPRM